MADPDQSDRRHTAAAVCTVGYLTCTATAAVVRSHYDDVCWGKGPLSALAEASTVTLAAAGFLALAVGWLASTLLPSPTRLRLVSTTAAGTLAVLTGLGAAFTAWPPYC